MSAQPTHLPVTDNESIDATECNQDATELCQTRHFHGGQPHQARDSAAASDDPQATQLDSPEEFSSIPATTEYDPDLIDDPDEPFDDDRHSNTSLVWQFVDESDCSPWRLTEPQKRAIELLLAGRRDRQVAEEVGVHRNTVWRWRQKNEEFRAVLSYARKWALRDAAARLRELAPMAVDVVHHQLTRLNLQAAARVLQLIRIEEVSPD